MKSIPILISIMMLGAAPAYSQTTTPRQQESSQAKSATRYACPMHPDVVSSRPGKCPKCGMKLRAVAPKSNPTPPSGPATTETNDSSLASLHIPDVTVYDQNGKRLRFYSDLVKGRTVAINFIFTTCTTICPPMTATFRRVQQQLGESAASNIHLISVSIDPVIDVPERLHDFAAKFNAGPGWTFVTGDKAEIDSLLQALGAAVADKNDHTPMILVGNDAAGFWTRAYGLSPPTTLTKLIREAAEHK